MMRIFFFFFLFFFSFAVFGQDDDYALKAQKALDLGDKVQAAQYYNQAADRQIQNSNITQAIVYLEKSVELNEEIGNAKAVSVLCVQLGFLHNDNGNAAAAVRYIERSLQLSTKLNDRLGVAEAHYNLGNVCLDNGLVDKAIQNLERAKELLLELKNYELLKKCYMSLYSAYDKKGESGKTAEYFSLYSALDKQLKSQEIQKIKEGAQSQINSVLCSKNETEEKLSKTKQELKETVDTLTKAKAIARQKQVELELNSLKLRETENLLNIEQLKRSRYALALGAILIVLVIIAFFGLRLKRASIKIQSQKKILEIQNENITASLNYSKMIQNAFLPEKKAYQERYDSLVVYRPKDIVSGDFYWHTYVSVNGTNYDVFAVADCTGHGVPGALMSVVGNSLLSEVINENLLIEPHVILEKLDQKVIERLKQKETKSKDGMEIGICVLSKKDDGTVFISYSGAKRPLYILKENSESIEIIAPTRRSIGGRVAKKEKEAFAVHELTFGKNDCFFMFSDGIIDLQNEKREKFSSLKFRELLVSIALCSLSEQEIKINSAIDDYKKMGEQRDDICIVGIKI